MSEYEERIGFPTERSDHFATEISAKEARQKLHMLDAMALGLGVKPISVMIDDMASKSKYRVQPKPHQGVKEMARRKKKIEGSK